MLLEYLHIARKVLVAHKFRSLLTVLSITIGAFSIVLMSSLAQSGSTTLFKDIEELGGARLVAVFPKQAEREEQKAASYTRGITVEDRNLIFASTPHLESHTMYANGSRKDVISDSGRQYRVGVWAADGDWFDAMHLAIGRGRFFGNDEDQRHQRVCVVGHKTALALWDGLGVGHTLQVGPLRCQVIGQSNARDFIAPMAGLDRLDYVAVPFESLADVDATVKPRAQIMLKTDNEASNDIVKRVVNAILNERHHGVDDFQMFDFSSVMDSFEGFFKVMQTIVGFIAGIALLVGGVGVMNMMLVSVSERVREIGIRKALGASPTDIASQFLLEAIVLAGSGGVIGVTGGVGMSYVVSEVIRHFKPRWVTVIADSSVVVALLVSVGVGLFFGFFPARRAARLDAIAAIRGT
jgi:putative ABC transport system permease protein